MSERVRARLIVIGRVQGVFYRQSTRETAHALGLSGWVRNQDDGTVALEAAGSREAVERLIAWCHKGPPSARVDAVQVEWLDVSGLEEGSAFHVVS